MPRKPAAKSKTTAAEGAPSVMQGHRVLYCPTWPVAEGEEPQTRTAFVALTGTDGKHALFVIWAPGDKNRDPESTLGAVPFSSTPTPGTWTMLAEG